MGGGYVEARLRVFSGNPLRGKYQLETASDWFSPLPDNLPGSATFESRPGAGILIQLLQAGLPPTNMLLPAPPYMGCQVVLATLPDGTVGLDAQLPERGLPIFSDGLSYAVDRPRLYLGTAQSSPGLEGLDRADEVLAQLQRFAAHVDFRKPILTFSGIDPDQPDDSPPEDDVEGYEGFDAGGYLG